MRQFGATAHAYATSEVHRSSESLDVLLELLANGPYDRVADIGTGTGFTAFAIAPRARVTLAVDPTAQMLDETRRGAAERGLTDAVRPLRAAAESLPCRDSALDAVACRVAAHHFADVAAFLRECARALRPGGRLLMADTSTPEEPWLQAVMNRWERLRDPSHVWNISPSGWRGALHAAGLVVTAQRIALTPLVFAPWVARSRTPSEVAALVEAEMRSAAPALRQAFRIEERPDGLHFAWPTCVTAAVRP